MSFFSSLLFIYPLDTPKLTASDIMTFTTRLYESGLCKQSTLQSVCIDYGEAIDNDIDDEDEDDEGSILVLGAGTEQWDHHAEEGAWSGLWPSESDLQKTVCRAEVCLGWLAKSASGDLTSQKSPDDWRSSIAPDMISFGIGPALANTLATDGDICPGFVSIRLSGNGYFSWQPLDQYWQQIGGTSTVSIIAKLCREFLPAPKFEFSETENDIFGKLFLNKENRKSGDWIVSISETG